MCLTQIQEMSLTANQPYEEMTANKIIWKTLDDDSVVFDVETPYENDSQI